MVVLLIIEISTWKRKAVAHKNLNSFFSLSSLRFLRGAIISALQNFKKKEFSSSACDCALTKPSGKETTTTTQEEKRTEENRREEQRTPAEKLFEMLRINDKRYPVELKIRIMQLISRVVSLNKLVVLGFYSYIVK